MINQDILSFIRDQIKAGTSRDIIREALVTKGGWKLADVEEAFRAVETPTPTPVQPIISKPVAPAPAPAPISPSPISQPVMPGVTVQSISTPKPQPVIVPQPKVTTTTTIPEQIQTMAPLQPKMSAPQPVAQPAGFSIPISTPKTIPVMQTVMPKSPLSVDSMTKVTPSPMPQTPVQPKPMTPPAMQTASPSTLYQPTRADVMPTFSGISASDMLEKAKPRTTGKKLALVFAILLVVLILGGGGVFGYFYYIAPTPANAFSRMMMNLQNTNTGHYTATITATFDKASAEMLIPAPAGLTPANFNSQSSNESQATLTIDGTFDRSNASMKKNRNTISLTTTLTPINPSFETRLIGDTLFVKVPDLGFLADVIGTDTLGFMPGDWVKISRGDLVALAKDAPEVQALPQMQNGSLTGQLTDEQKDKIKNLFLTGGVITPTVALPSTTMGGVSVNRYQFSVDKDALKNAIKETYSIVSGAIVLPSITNSINQSVESFTVSDGEVYIGTWDGILRGISFNIKPTDVSLQNVVNLKFSLSFDGFGQTVSITAPNTSLPFISILEDARKKGKDSSIKANITSVKAQAELFYSKKRSYLGLCTSDTGLKPTITALGSLIAPASVFCKDGARTYVVAAPLISENNFYCIDNKGTALSIATLPTGTVCQ